MEARDEQSTYCRVSHTLEWPCTLCGDTGRRQGLPTQVAPHLRACIEARGPRIGAALGGLSVREIGREKWAPYNDPDGRLLFNVNTPDDFALTTGR